MHVGVEEARSKGLTPGADQGEGRIRGYMRRGNGVRAATGWMRWITGQGSTPAQGRGCSGSPVRGGELG